nr:hypothetical protein [Deltaproteobacteria bacterium]
MDARAVLLTIGLIPEDADALVALLEDPTLGILDRDDFIDAPSANELIALRAALVALINTRRYQPAIVLLTEWLEPVLEALTVYDAARFWHMRGLAALRFERTPFAAIRALNIAAHLLITLQDDAAEAAAGYRLRGAQYLARVHDTFGQILLQQGFLAEAHREFTDALRLRAPDDDVGRGISLGNLGRVFMD